MTERTSRRLGNVAALLREMAAEQRREGDPVALRLERLAAALLAPFPAVEAPQGPPTCLCGAALALDSRG
jgi:hypothetical protein